MARKTNSYYGGADITYPERPSKPGTFDRNDPASLREYADKMEKYQLEKEAYTNQMSAYRRAIQSRKNELKRDLAAENDINSAQASVLFNVAWEDGHSGGINEVIDRFEQLVEIIYDFNQAGEQTE